MCVHGMCMCVCVHIHTVQCTPSQDALAGRVNPLPNVSPLANRNMLEEGVDQELQIQFLVGKCKQPLVYHSSTSTSVLFLQIPEELESIEITELDQAPGNPLYQVSWSIL